MTTSAVGIKPLSVSSASATTSSSILPSPPKQLHFRLPKIVFSYFKFYQTYSWMVTPIMAPQCRTSGSRCTSSLRVTATLLLSFLAIAPTSASRSNSDPLNEDILLPPVPGIPEYREPPSPAEHIFTLRHIYHHGTHQHPSLHRRRDVLHDEPRLFLQAEDGYDHFEIPTLKAKSNAVSIERLKDRRPSVVDPMVAEARQRGFAAVLDGTAWTRDEVPGPDMTDKDTVLNLAYMAANAYVEEKDLPDWEDVGAPFNLSLDFGWQSDGLRGHIYTDKTNSTVVIGLKGTSLAVFDGEGTTTNDKVNDNLFFSCCCAQQGAWTWHQVCDCATGTYTCNNTCVVQAIREENRYYAAARELYSNVTEQYPEANIWLTGHSLGGAVSGLLGLTYGLPVATFESPPEALAASRLGLPVPPGANPKYPQEREFTGAFHFGHTADPIYIGTCNGAAASCSFAGYALESACHTGRECVYDVVADKGWRVGIGTHRIRSVIHDVIMKYDDVPICESTPECRDCAPWKMYESNGTESTTTSSFSTSTLTRTRTSTCQTPGWWGCLDKTTATATTATTTTSTTSTCKTPGWFGCKDKTTTTEVTSTQPVSTTSTTATTSTTTCETPGRFWGCHDEEPTSSAQTGTPPTPGVTAAPTATPTSTSTSSASPPDRRKCQYRNWFGFCKDWQGEETGFISDEM